MSVSVCLCVCVCGADLDQPVKPVSKKNFFFFVFFSFFFFGSSSDSSPFGTRHEKGGEGKEDKSIVSGWFP